MVGAEQTITTVCACGKKLKAPASAAGKKARCRACGNVVELPSATVAARPRPAPVLRSAPVEDDGLGALYELAEQANAAVPIPERPQCPRCRNAMEADAVLCMGCGYDVRSGKSLTTATAIATNSTGKGGARTKASSRANGKAVVDRMVPEGSFIKGIVLSVAFAAVASLLWIVVALVTGFTIAWLGLLIGAAAGLGMQVGQKGYSSAGGSVAAGITLAVILGAKLAVVAIYLSRHNPDVSIFDLNGAALGFYMFSPIGLIIMAISMGAAFRTANGSSK